MIRFIFLSLILVCFVSVKAQGWSVGGYVTPTYGNIVYKSKTYQPAYQPVFTTGGGLIVNYYKNRWMFSTGLNFKYTGASQNIPVTTVADPDGTSGNTKPVWYFEHILTIPLGCYYEVVNKEKIRIYPGIVFENGQLLMNKLYFSGEDFHKFDKTNHLKLTKGYYMGIMPQVKADISLSARKLLFLQLGSSQQLNYFKPDVPAIVASAWPEKFKVDNLFMDIGFAYRLKKE